MEPTEENRSSAQHVLGGVQVETVKPRINANDAKNGTTNEQEQTEKTEKSVIV